MSDSIEDLQAEILKLKQDNENQKTQIDELTKDKEKVSDDLANAREFNSKLMKQINIGSPTFQIDDPEPEKHIETEEEFIDSFINPIKEEMEETYGVKFNGYDN